MNINRYTTTTYLILLVSLSLSAQVRSYDGYGNNPNNPEFGSSGSEIRYIAPRQYADGISMPNGLDRPNPRSISNQLFAQSELIYDEHSLTDYIWVFGQFLDHDITLIRDAEHEPAFINVPACDPVFDPTCSGASLIMMSRSRPMEGTGSSVSNPRSFENEITAFIDGSGVYGSTEERALWLRSFQDGKLKVSTGNLLPFNTVTGELNGATDSNAPEMDVNDPTDKRWFVAGDVRANENVMLTAMHTLFVREHNRMCDEIKQEFPGWTDEQIYQRARKMISGMIQSITYNEWLPAMGVTLDPYSGFRDDINPGVTNVFSAAAFRFGHTLLSQDLLRMQDDCNTVPQGDMTLRDAFFKPEVILTTGIDPLVKGMSAQIQQKLDCKVVDDVRNFLFGPPGTGFGLDLAAININRGRERGLPDYNSIRGALGLGRVRDFKEVTSNIEDAIALEELYSDVDKVDPWVGFLAEEHVPGAMFGESIMAVMIDQFKSLRDGDRFYYEVDPELSEAEKALIRNSKMSDIVRRNTSVKAIQENAFVMERTCNDIEIEQRHLEMLAYPNPVRTNFDLSLYSFEEGEGSLTIQNMLGATVYRRNVEIQKGTNEFFVALNGNLPVGFYTVQMKMGERRNALKLLRVN